MRPEKRKLENITGKRSGRLREPYGQKGGIVLKSNEPNRSISCTVENCVYHCGGCDYCSLENISIGSHEERPHRETGVDCQSFCDEDGSAF